MHAWSAFIGLKVHTCFKYIKYEVSATGGIFPTLHTNVELYHYLNQLIFKTRCQLIDGKVHLASRL